MKLREYEAKAIFSQHGIYTPLGIVVRDVSEAKKAIEQIGYPVVLKPQTLIKARGKAGLIRFVETDEEIELEVKALLRLRHMQEKIDQILLEEKIEAVREIYAGIIIDRTKGKPIIIISSEGGIDVESIVNTFPEKVSSIEVDVLSGIREYQIRVEAKKIGLRGTVLVGTAKVVIKLYEIFRKYDAEVVEANPLMVTKEGKIVAIDALIDIDDDSQRARAARNTVEEPFSIVELDGNIGVIGNGAGLTLATLDMIHFYGGRPAFFFDIGGGMSSERMKRALETALKKAHIKVLLVNIFAG
ncbi:MAG: acetate--CoA ligase family protein, partial [Candidatus Bathyarchaeota archaeon]